MIAIVFVIVYWTLDSVMDMHQKHWDHSFMDIPGTPKTKLGKWWKRYCRFNGNWINRIDADGRIRSPKWIYDGWAIFLVDIWHGAKMLKLLVMLAMIVYLGLFDYRPVLAFIGDVRVLIPAEILLYYVIGGVTHEIQMDWLFYRRGYRRPLLQSTFPWLHHKLKKNA